MEHYEHSMKMLREEVSRRDEQVREAYGTIRFYEHEIRMMKEKNRQLERTIIAQLGEDWLPN